MVPDLGTMGSTNPVALCKIERRVSIRGERRSCGSKREVKRITVPREFGGFPRGGARTGEEEEELGESWSLAPRAIGGEEEWCEEEWEPGVGFYSRCTEGQWAPRPWRSLSTAIGRDGGAGVCRGV